MSAFVALCGLAMAGWQGGPTGVVAGAAAIFPAIYLGLPIGAMVAVRETAGREALFLMMLTIVVSDTAQYYSGRAFGRRLLAPAISPKKTIEGALGGFLCGGVFLALVGGWWLPSVPAAAPSGARRHRRRARDCRRPLRVDAQAERRIEGQLAR